MQTSYKAFHDEFSKQHASMQGQSVSVGGLLDDMQIMQHNMQRMQRNLTPLVENMEQRQAKWDAQQKGGAAIS